MTDRLSLIVGYRFFASGSRTRLASFISLLAISGLVLGVALLIIVLSVMNGFEREMRTRILGVVPPLQLYEAGGVGQWQQLSERLEQHPGIHQATPFTRFQAMVNFRGQVQALEVQGLNPLALDSALAANLPPRTSQWLADGDLVLSRTLADKLGVSEGQRVTLIAPRQGDDGRQLPVMRAFYLGGIFDTHTAEDNALALVHIDQAGRITGLMDKPEGLRLRVADVFGVRELGYELVGQLPRGFSAANWFQTHGNLYQAIQLSRQLVGFLIFLIIAIAVFNVISMLVMTVVDKRPAVGILKTLGAGNGTILAIFMVQGTLIGVLGCGLGLALGVAGALFVSDAVAGLEVLLGIQFLDPEIYPIDYVPSDLRLGDMVTVALAALALNFLATLYPAWKAAGVRPAEILRYE